MTAPAHKGQSPPLPLDLETAPDEPARPLGTRAYVGGVLYVEGLVVLLMGATLLGSYWPPIKAPGEPANPISQFGMWMSGIAVLYMVVVGVSVFLYNLIKPATDAPGLETREAGAVSRARRYASMKKRTRYIFDNTICCEADAEEAMRARDLY